MKLDSLIFICSQLLKLKIVFKKRILITYQGYKKYYYDGFRSKIQSFCSKEMDLSFFKDSILNVLKITFVQEKPIGTKESHNVIMK